MTNDITLSELQEFIAGFWYHYDAAHYDELAARYAEDVRYVTRSDTGASPFEELMSPELRGRDAVMDWLSEHREQSPNPLRHHATNVHRTGTYGDVAEARFYILVNQIANFVPVRRVQRCCQRRRSARGVRAGNHRDGRRAGHPEFVAAVRAAPRHRRDRRLVVAARETFSGGVAVVTGAGAGIGAGIARHAVALGMRVVLADVDGDADSGTARRASRGGGFGDCRRVRRA